MTNSSNGSLTGKAATLEARILDALHHRVGKTERAAKPHDWYNAAVLAMRDDIIDNWFASTDRTHAAEGKRVYYLSLEFLIGRLLRDAKLYEIGAGTSEIRRMLIGREMMGAMR